MYRLNRNLINQQNQFNYGKCSAASETARFSLLVKYFLASPQHVSADSVGATVAAAISAVIFPIKIGGCIAAGSRQVSSKECAGKVAQRHVLFDWRFDLLRDSLQHTDLFLW